MYRNRSGSKSVSRYNWPYNRRLDAHFFRQSGLSASVALWSPMPNVTSMCFYYFPLCWSRYFSYHGWSSSSSDGMTHFYLSGNDLCNHMCSGYYGFPRSNY